MPSSSFSALVTATDDPLMAWMNQFQALGPEEASAEMEAMPDMFLEDMDRWSNVTLTIHVKRVTTYYQFNFLMIVVLLTASSFASFLLDKTALDGRLGLTLTVVLGLNVFQLVIIDSVPPTGYITDTHVFVVFSTGLAIGVAIVHLIVNWAVKRVARLEKAAAAFAIVGGKAKKDAAAPPSDRASGLGGFRALASKNAGVAIAPSRSGDEGDTHNAACTATAGAAAEPPPPWTGSRRWGVLGGLRRAVGTARSKHSQLLDACARVTDDWLDGVALLGFTVGYAIFMSATMYNALSPGGGNELEEQYCAPTLQ